MQETAISPEQVKELLKNPLLITRELNNRSLYHFLEYFWPVVSAHTFTPNWHIKYLCDELEAVAQRVGNRQPKLHDVLINISPGSTKTIMCSIMFPAWCWTKWHWMRCITASYSSQLSLESADYCRDLIKSQQFREVYPDIMIKEDKDVKSNYKIVKTVTGAGGVHRRGLQLAGGGRYSTSVGGTLTGFHGDILIWDDPLKPDEAVSDIGLANANRWIEQTLSTRKTDKEVSVIIGIMQRLSQNDCSGYILDKQKENIKHICIPGEIRNFKKMLNPPELAQFYIDDLFDPKRMSWKVLKDMEADLGQYGFAGQIGQDPTPPGGGMFKVDRFTIMTQYPMRNEIMHSIRAWDKAGTQDAGDYTVGCKMSKLTGNRILVEDIVRGRWATQERERIIRSVAEADGPYVEIWLEQEPGSSGKDSAEATIRNLVGYRAFAEKSTGDKEFRADPYSVQVNNGGVFLMQGAWNLPYLQELRYFPHSTHKDQTDSSSLAFNKLTNKRLARRVT